MKTKKIIVCDAIHYDVSCEHNDSVDIKCGGPVILGYNFIVSPDENQVEMIKFLENCIKKYDRPFMGISTNIIKDFPIDKLWKKEKIEDCIKNQDI